MCRTGKTRDCRHKCYTRTQSNRWFFDYAKTIISQLLQVFRNFVQYDHKKARDSFTKIWNTSVHNPLWHTYLLVTSNNRSIRLKLCLNESQPAIKIALTLSATPRAMLIAQVYPLLQRKKFCTHLQSISTTKYIW
jgi:hypothetical protein